MITLHDVLIDMINPAMALLPARMDSFEARVVLLTIGQQESRFEHRRQMGNGPARSFWQFELGTKASRGGVWGVFLHDASRGQLLKLCAARGIDFEPSAIWTAIEHDDVLAAGLARLLLFTDPRPLPAVWDVEAAWNLYALRTWRPGKPHRETWNGYHLASRRALGITA